MVGPLDRGKAGEELLSKLEQEGVVLSVAGDIARVRTSRHSDCENCGACPGNDALVLDARNPLAAKPGQLVVVEVQDVNMLKSAFIVYMLPLIALGGGAAAGGYAAQRLVLDTLWLPAAGAVLAFAATLLYIRYFDRKVKKDTKMLPVIIRILS